MSNPDYMKWIDDVADQWSKGKSTPLANRIIEAWQKLESMAEKIGYDVLSNLSYDHKMRQEIRALIVILYEVPGADVKKDCDQLREKNASYGGSWCKRGGTGAFHMLARKADRLETLIKENPGLVFSARRDGESLEDTLGDLRRYLILVESYHVAREHTGPDLARERSGASRCNECGHHRNIHARVGKCHADLIGKPCECTKFVCRVCYNEPRDPKLRCAYCLGDPPICAGCDHIVSGCVCPTSVA